MMKCGLRLTYSVREASEILSISEWLVREECARGNIDCVKIGYRTVIPCWSIMRRLGMPLDCPCVLADPS